MMTLNAVRLSGRALDLEGASRGVGGQRIGSTFRCLDAAGLKPERIPVEAEAATGDDKDRQDHPSQQSTPPRRQGSENNPGIHGKAFRSSSKCGPSRRLVQSPPQTMAVP